ncbi:ACT domain-containing protein [Cognatishimia sp.]|uniref:ACT domain-containing protein n=1 Tax=Cognatishimia sp. TaxID=2211648 RepID=UPI00351834BD
MTQPVSEPVKDTRAMISGMAPALDPEIYHFCCVPRGADPQGVSAKALARFCEDEGETLILPEQAAQDAGLVSELPMQRITLMVHSALDGVGLTAAVASVLAEAGIACNMVAAFHHDHAFVPAQDAERALALLKALAGAQT